MRFKKQFFSFLLIASFLMSHSLAEYAHQLYHASRNEICLDSKPVPAGTNTSQGSACPIEKLLKSVASESFHFSTSVTLADLSFEHGREAQLFTKIYSVPAYEDEFSRGPPAI